MTSPAMNAKNILVSKGIVRETDPTATEWLVRIGKMPESPDQVVTVYDTGGFTPFTKWQLDQPTIQVMIRGDKNGYENAWNKALEVKDILLGIEPLDIDEVHWSGATMLGDIAFLKYDDSDRPLFSANFRIFLERNVTPLSNRNSLDYTGP